MKWILLFLFSFSFSLTAQASEMISALSASQGGTGRAAVEATEAIYLNPASLALVQGFHTGFGYQTGFLSKDVSRNTYSVTLADATKDIMFPGSFGYRRHSINAQGRRFSENEFRAGLGYRLMPRLSLGLGANHLRATTSAGVEHNQTNVDLGVLIGLMPQWGLSFSGENLVDRSEVDIPEALRRLSRVAIGTQYVHEKSITFRYEALMPLYLENTQLLAHRFGLGFDLKNRISLNTGYSVDDSLSQNWTSLGFAWKGPRLKLAYSYQVEDRSSLGSRHLVDLWVDI